MKKEIITWAVIFGLLMLVQVKDANATDDKQMHAVVSSMMAGAAVVYLEDKTDNPVAWSIAAAMLPGVAKEIYDAGHPKNHTAEAGDLAADLAGAVAGAVVGHNVMIRLHRDGVSVGIKSSF